MMGTMDIYFMCKLIWDLKNKRQKQKQNKQIDTKQNQKHTNKQTNKEYKTTTTTFR